MAATWLLTGAYALGLFAYTYRLCLVFGKSSDQANTLLAGIDMLHGNWRLCDWWMVPDSFWLSEIPLAALLSGLRRLAGLSEISPSTLILQPAITWVALCLVSIGLAQRHLATRPQRVWAAIIVLAACGVPVMRGGTAPIVFLSAIHFLTILLALLTFQLGQAVLTGTRWQLALCAMIVVLLLNHLSDPLALFICTMPILAAVPFAHAASHGRRLILAGAVLASPLVASLLLLLNVRTGGFIIGRLPLDFAAFSDLGSNIAVALHGLLRVFSADFTDPAATDVTPELLHLILLVLAVAIVAAVLRNMLRAGIAPRIGGEDLISLCLCLGIAVGVAALIFSQRIEHEQNPVASGRYLFPAWVFASIVLAERTAVCRPVRLLASAALASALLCNLEALRRPTYEAVSAQHHALLRALQAQKVSFGLAGYWEAALMQIASRDTLHLQPVILDPAGRLVPLRNNNKPFEIRDLTAQDFVVVVHKPRQFFGRDSVEHNFGPPLRVEELADYILMFYAGLHS